MIKKISSGGQKNHLKKYHLMVEKEYLMIFQSDDLLLRESLPLISSPSDRMGDHALGCAKHGDRIARHDQLRDVLYEAAASAALAPVKEERHLLPGTAARPGDVMIR